MPETTPEERARRGLRSASSALCPNCGLPMSLSYWNGDESNPPIWYCDGPNDNTKQLGCYHTLEIKPGPEELREIHQELTETVQELTDGEHRRYNG